MILLAAESLGRKHNRENLGRKLFIKRSSLSRKQEIVEASTDAKYDRQSWLEAKIGGLVYTLWFWLVVFVINLLFKRKML